MGRAMLTSGMASSPEICLKVPTNRPAYLNTPRAARFRTMPTTSTAFLRPWEGCRAMRTPQKKFTRMDPSMMRM